MTVTLCTTSLGAVVASVASLAWMASAVGAAIETEDLAKACRL